MRFSKLSLQLTAMAVLLVLSGVALQAQAPAAKRPAFDVVSVKPSKTCTGDRPIISPGTLHLPCSSLRVLVQMAYSGFAGEQISSGTLEAVGWPAWVDSERFTIDARSATKTTAATLLGQMVQSLLEERFQLKIHKEARETSAYLLTVQQQNPNLRPSEPGACVPIDLFEKNAGRPLPFEKQCGAYRSEGNSGTVSMKFNSATMAEFAFRLTGYVRRPVVDRTGLDGRFDFHVEFLAQLPSSSISDSEAPALAGRSVTSTGDSVFGAIQKQLGLKLTTGKAPVEVLVIDSVERPSEN